VDQGTPPNYIQSVTTSATLTSAISFLPTYQTKSGIAQMYVLPGVHDKYANRHPYKAP
jgi:hypothetical protein